MDVDDDGTPDLLSGGGRYLPLGTADAVVSGFATEARPPIGRAGDFNGDGMVDLVYPDAVADSLVVRLSVSAEPAEPLLESSVDYVSVSQVGDVDGDGVDDVIVGSPVAGARVWRGAGNGEFQPMANEFGAAVSDVTAIPGDTARVFVGTPGGGSAYELSGGQFVPSSSDLVQPGLFSVTGLAPTETHGTVVLGVWYWDNGISGVSQGVALFLVEDGEWQRWSFDLEGSEVVSLPHAREISGDWPPEVLVAIEGQQGHEVVVGCMDSDVGQICARTPIAEAPVALVSWQSPEGVQVSYSDEAGRVWTAVIQANPDC